MKTINKFRTACGKEIHITEKTRKHLLAHSDVLEFLEEAISKIRIPQNTKHFCKAVSFGRIVGISRLVETEKILPGDETDFAFRLERKKPSRITFKSNGKPCDSVTLEIKFDGRAKKYFLSTAYIGYPCPYEPGYIKNQKSFEFKKALAFWCKHALAYDSKIMGKPFKSSWNGVLK